MCSLYRDADAESTVMTAYCVRTHATSLR